MPQIRETSTGFRSKILDAYVSRTEKLDELIARMYVHGMSTRDIEATFADVLSGTGRVEVGGESGDAVSVGRFRGVS